MPSPFVDKFGAAGEKLWDEAKEIAKKSRDENDPLFFGLVTKIFKEKVKKAGLNPKETLTGKIQSLFTVEVSDKNKKRKKKTKY